MTETKKLIEVIEGTIQAYQKGERLPISKQGIEYLKEIKGILEGKQKYSLKGVCEWWIKTYPEDVFKKYEYITDIREHMVKILEKLQVAIPQCEPQPQPDEELDTFFCDLYYDYTAGFCNLQDGDKPHEEDEAKIKQIRKLLKGEI